MKLVLGLGINGRRGLLGISVPPAADAILNPDGTISVVSTDDPILFSISSPEEYAGSYRVAVAALPAIATIDGGANDGQQKVFPITGISRQGATLTCVDPLWTYDEAAGPVTVSRQWRAAGANITGETGLTYVVDYADVNFAAGNVPITVEHTLVQGAVTRTYTTTAYTLVKPMVEKIETFKIENAVTATPTATYHLFGFEKVLVAFGPNTLPTSLTVGGVAATQIAQAAGLSGARLTLYEFAITTPADAAIVANLAAAAAPNGFGVWGINGVIKSSTVNGPSNAGTYSLSRTPTNTTNAIIALSIGRDDVDIAITGADSVEVFTDDSTTSYAGVIKNAPLTAQTVTWTLADRAGLALVLVEPV